MIRWDGIKWGQLYPFIFYHWKKQGDNEKKREKVKVSIFEVTSTQVPFCALSLFFHSNTNKQDKANNIKDTLWYQCKQEQQQ